MQTLLLNKEDFADTVDAVEALDMARLRPHILAAQKQRLLPLLSAALLTELLRRQQVERAAAGAVPPTTPDDADRLSGPWLELREKAVAVLAPATMARYMPFAQTTLTSNSAVRKTSAHSEPVDGRDLARQASIYDGDALSAEVELRAWLITNAAGFASYYLAPACGVAAPGRVASAVVVPIRRPDYPRPR